MSALASRRAFLAAALCASLCPRWVPAKAIGGVTVPERALLAGPLELPLRGAGVFRFLFIRYYVCGLYAQGGLRAAPAILAADAPRRISLFALRRITAFEFLWGLDRGLTANASGEELKALEAQLESVRATVREIGAIPEHARVDIDYLPPGGTLIAIDGRRRAGPLPGKPLNDALMRVWIGERPLDAALKEALLNAQTET